ncbi:MAG: DUF4405 domain-containing protein [Dysgonomonas sp.]|nr:DUF4405 domain-containing protein [Dysgonomonas sp.]
MSSKFSLTKGKSIFIVDILLIPIFILVIYSGLELHIAGHDTDHEIWSHWAHIHIITSVVSLIVGSLHIKAHWNWYKGLVKKGWNRKSKVTISISFLFLILTITGIVLVLFIDGGNSSVGLWHYRLGLIMTALLVIHTISRFPLIIKGLKKKRKDSKKRIVNDEQENKNAA